MLVNEAIIRDALKFKEGHEDLFHRFIEKDRGLVFLQIKGKEGTFDDMGVEEEKLALRLFTQHFNLRNPQKFTRPHRGIAHCMSLAAKDIPQARPNFANYVLKNLQAHANSSNVKQEPCLYASHMLTRIAYQALGMQEELPKAITQSQPKARK